MGSLAMQTHTVLIVGGGSGIGEKVTQSIIRYSAAQVVVFGLHISDEIAALQKTETGRLWSVKGDITSPEDRQTALAVCIEKMGKIDSLVISAGVMGEIQRVADQSPTGLRSDFEINFFGPMEMVRRHREDQIMLVLMEIGTIDHTRTSQNQRTYPHILFIMRQECPLRGLDALLRLESSSDESD